MTPFIAILRQLYKNGDIKDCKLLFANKSTDDIILRDEFEMMLGENFINIADTSNDPKVIQGHIDKALLQKYVSEETQYFYVCGPDKFIAAMMGYLHELGVADDQIIIEQ